MNKPLNPLRVVGLVSFFVLLVLACQQQELSPLSQAQTKASVQAAAQDNNDIIANAQDVVNVTGSAFANQGLTFGRVADGDGGDDDDECKPSVTNNLKIDRSNADSIVISGLFIIDFGTGASCPDSAEMRKGKIIDSLYVVITKTMYKSSESITFQNYWRDSTNVDGSITIKSSTDSGTVVKVNGSKIHYHDGTTSSWKGSIVFTKHPATATSNATMTLTGSWSGTTRAGKSFSANITKEILFKAGCFGHRHKFIPVSGTIDMTVGGTTSTIDFGDGTCDRLYTVTTGGTTTTHKLG